MIKENMFNYAMGSENPLNYVSFYDEWVSQSNVCRDDDTKVIENRQDDSSLPKNKQKMAIAYVSGLL